MSNRVLHCWEDRAFYYKQLFGFHSDEHIRASYVDPSATCMLEAGHSGPHEWTSDDQIGVKFAEESDDV